MKRFIFVLLLAVLLGGTAVAGDYLIGEGDLLKISVWGVPELSVEVVVRPDGKITLPAAGDIVAAGIEPVALGTRLNGILKNFVKKPIVTVTVSQITNNRIYLSGGGVKPEVVNLAGKTTLFRLLCGLENLENGDLRHAYVLRGKKVVRDDFHGLFINGEFDKDIELQANDIIFIPNNEQNKVYVVGAVNEPKYIIYREGMKVLDAVLEAGGLNEFAKESEIKIVRKNQADRAVEIKIKMSKILNGKDVAQNIQLNPGDYIVINEGIF